MSELAIAIRRRAERALLVRLDAGAGFASAQLPSQVYLRDADASARVGGSLRPRGTHAKALAALVVPPIDDARLALAAQRMGLDAVASAIFAIAIGYAIDLDTRELVHALAPRRKVALHAETIAEIGELAPRDVLAALVVGGPLRRGRLIYVEGDGLSSTIEVSPAVLHWWLGADDLTPPLSQIATLRSAEVTILPESLATAITSTASRVTDLAGANVAVIVRGPRGSGRRAVAEQIAAKLSRSLLVVRVRELLTLERRTRAALLANLVAAARLRDAIVYFEEVDALYDERGDMALDHRDAITSIAGVVLASTAQRAHVELHRPQLSITMPRMELVDRERAWIAAIGTTAETGNDLRKSTVAIDLPGSSIANELAGRYVIGPGAIADVVAEAKRYAATAGTSLTVEALEASVGRRLTVRLGTYGTVVHRKARFAELVLSADVVDTLHDMIAMVRERTKILEQWGYQRHLGISRGVAGLFSGEPGTGKTMAASVVASELGLELVRIDLSAVVSKYVGETEKNLGKIFDEAQDAHAMLLFDEADSLFGKRTELKSAQDRFANLEVNYILQRMETFDGVSVLTTNAEAAIDPALQRRLNFRIRFPEPEPEERAELWRRLLPPGAGLHDRVDFTALADKFDMTGGYIKNAVVRAAVIAARANRALTVEDLWAGAHSEYVEMGKVMPQPLHR